MRKFSIIAVRWRQRPSDEIIVQSDEIIVQSDEIIVQSDEIIVQRQKE